MKITEIFFSLQGETNTVGLPTVFIRLTGCPLRCQYCDTAYAFSGGKNYTIDEVLTTISSYKTKYVTVTGGEPLAQTACHALLKKLCDLDYIVSLETSGALAISAVDPRVIKIVDIKTPGSLEVAKNNFDNVPYLLSHDQVKFVICDRNDYEWSKKIMDQFKLSEKCDILFSPSFNQMRYADLADWILADQLPVRFQVQLHKVIWGDVAGK
ncbi:MAG: 7-carboxy-7-deazaguanine synthase QueE [Gammaproteobacteria bacterium CG_4_10_14_0_8_um_filter_38_16]|nr:MAG: 7-carboxy-7-deazaguanine synthase QueE [Gammaproteobacteria bacterium CG_4_10_14_0_8_um_filter_38_16]PJA03886.1 MAG: 7-carboxy-7-deazaguanine synthase QueE [Gammaproteobacteria bacterium CG_4_10_14_0_2_um_filter_38_22]PJB09500.1 MAG: 7-carboxy-7-deazaguanine synthase QueE [Gammaproteobacteria bacterium CG_4_9_14_3_um_filter_38_9]